MQTRMAGQQAKGYTGRLYHKQSLHVDPNNSATTTTVSNNTTTNSTTARTSAARGRWYRRSVPAPLSNTTHQMVLSINLASSSCNHLLYGQLCTRVSKFHALICLLFSRLYLVYGQPIVALCRLSVCLSSVCNVCTVAKRYVVGGRRWYRWIGRW